MTGAVEAETGIVGTVDVMIVGAGEVAHPVRRVKSKAVPAVRALRATKGLRAERRAQRGPLLQQPTSLNSSR